MAYSPPTFAILRDAVNRDLRDPTGSVFGNSVDDYINDGITELNQIRPLEARVEVDATDPLTDLGLQDVFMIQSAVDPDDGLALNWTIVPANVDAPWPNGWEWFAGAVRFDSPTQRAIDVIRARYGDDKVLFAVYGYADRDLLEAEDDVADFRSSMDERIARAYARLQGYRALNSDRMLFAQWQQLANNSDISETQLQNSVYGFEAEFDRMRKRNLLIRSAVIG